VPMSHPMSEDLLVQVVHRLAVLAQPVRIRVVERLAAEGEMSVQALADDLDATQQKNLAPSDAPARMRRGFASPSGTAGLLPTRR